MKNFELYIPFAGIYFFVRDFEYLFRTEKIPFFLQVAYLATLTFFVYGR